MINSLKKHGVMQAVQSTLGMQKMKVLVLRTLIVVNILIGGFVYYLKHKSTFPTSNPVVVGDLYLKYDRRDYYPEFSVNKKNIAQAVLCAPVVGHGCAPDEVRDAYKIPIGTMLINEGLDYEAPIFGNSAKYRIKFKYGEVNFLEGVDLYTETTWADYGNIRAERGNICDSVRWEYCDIIKAHGYLENPRNLDVSAMRKLFNLSGSSSSDDAAGFFALIKLIIELCWGLLTGKF